MTCGLCLRVHTVCMKNLGHDQEDRGVEGGTEEVFVDEEFVTRRKPPTLDGLGQPVAPEDDLGSD